MKKRLALLTVSLILSSTASADEGGVGFWLPGTYGSLAALPAEPGWAFSLTYVHSDVSAEAHKTFKRGAKIVAGVDARSDLIDVGPTYTLQRPILGGRLSLSLLASGGKSKVNVGTSFSDNNNSSHFQDSSNVIGFGDLLPQATLAWNAGAHNVMTYVTGNVPVGKYDPDRLANVGLGYGAVDAGAGYTYFNPDSGNEASVVTGFTYSFENPDTHYQNGIDSHVDWGLSHFASPQVHLGIVGYYYQQLTGDSGSGATLGSFKSRVAGVVSLLLRTSCGALVCSENTVSPLIP